MSPRRGTSVALLLVIACALLGVWVVPAGSCGDDCGIDCGACVYCPAPATLALRQALAPPLDVAAQAQPASPDRPAAPLPRAIEHVPLGASA